ncbi:MAG TPA: hypothetical protein VK978_00205 [Candidatus Saccharimonadales bacterium]|nr:hypothetical protein [Candidatus Saccharimonadales bacterium]
MNSSAPQEITRLLPNLPHADTAEARALHMSKVLSLFCNRLGCYNWKQPLAAPSGHRRCDDYCSQHCGNDTTMPEP